MVLRRDYGNNGVTMNALDALGSPVRRDILLALRQGPLSMGALAEQFR
jgi:DNA-binding transcriptional ArsR family regulator